MGNFAILVYYLRTFVFPAMQIPELPTGFSYLADIDPSIAQSVRYYGHSNFMGRPFIGYAAPKIILTDQAATALAKVQEDLKQDNLGLVVYDGYRPQFTVDSIFEWSQDSSDDIAKELYYPTAEKSNLFDLGYIARKSGHSRGSTIDLSIIDLNGSGIYDPIISTRRLTDRSIIPFFDDGSVDMGSSFDLFHECSFHETPLVSDQATQWRNHLRHAMERNGFRAYAKEWWHYTLQNEPFPNTYFNFTIQ